MADAETLAFYAREATDYAQSAHAPSSMLASFAANLRPGAKVLELGTGAGHDAAFMLARGLDVTASDASPELALIAQDRLGRPVRLMTFSQLSERVAYDGVWANACLLHAPLAELPTDIARIFRALRRGGLFVASFKAGSGEGRDQFGRFYNYPSAAALLALYHPSANWADLSLQARPGRGYDNQPTQWLWVTARKPI